MRKLNHIGVPTNVSQPGEFYNEGLKVYLTDFTKSPNRLEFLRLGDETSPLAELIQTHTHLAYEVDDIDAEMKGKKVLMEKTVCSPELTIAFIEEEGIALELMQYTK
ncbi:MAG: hypothetical protein OSJ22_04575 [Rikenellaceae bacterium]|jgi:hypothetical protein|nr:hypothetical protein [Rikenellaceae bacterium]